jgi:fructose-specific phosphotransferase system component IIB
MLTEKQIAENKACILARDKKREMQRLAKQQAEAIADKIKKDWYWQSNSGEKLTDEQIEKINELHQLFFSTK